VRQDLACRHFIERMKIQGKQAPAEKRQGGVDDAGTHWDTLQICESGIIAEFNNLLS
jgi:hypothetical protein